MILKLVQKIYQPSALVRILSKLPCLVKVIQYTVHPKKYGLHFVVCYCGLCRSIYPYPSGLLHCQWGSHGIGPVTVKDMINTLRWRHNERDGVSNHQPHDCLLNRLFGRRLKKTSKLRVTGLCAGNSPVTGEFPAQMASNAENVSIWWRHHVDCTNPVRTVVISTTKQPTTKPR